MISYNQVRHVHLEISTKCNASCSQCPRNLFGADAEELVDYPDHDMRLDEAKQIFTPDFLKQLRAISINGNFGDFVTARDGLEIVQYFLEQNPRLRVDISTNGSARPNIWAELGKLGITVFFALDGLADTHAMYRQYTDWNMVINNAKNFIAAGGDAVWKMVKFDHNEHQIDQCRAMARDLGFGTFWLVDQGRNVGPVFDRKGELVHVMGTPKEGTDYLKILDTKISHKEWLKRTGHNPVILYKSKQDIPAAHNCETIERASIYITATGLVYPCCYTGFYPGQKLMMGNEQIAQLQQNNNALEHSIEECVEWFADMDVKRRATSYEDGSLYLCNVTCAA